MIYKPLFLLVFYQFVIRHDTSYVILHYCFLLRLISANDTYDRRLMMDNVYAYSIC